MDRRAWSTWAVSRCRAALSFGSVYQWLRSIAGIRAEAMGVPLPTGWVGAEVGRDTDGPTAVLSVSAHCMLRTFVGATSTWNATRFRPESATPASATPAVDSGTSAAAPLTLDAIDRTLFTELARDGRATLAELAKAVDRSPSSVQRHLDRLRGAGALSLAVDSTLGSSAITWPPGSGRTSPPPT